MADDRALEKVLELRKKQEDDALAKWAESERQLKIFADQLQKLSSFRDLYAKQHFIYPRHAKIPGLSGLHRAP